VTATRTASAILLAGAVLGSQAACGTEAGDPRLRPSAPAPSGTVSAACLQAMKDRIARASYDPFAPYAGRVAACEDEPVDAYVATARRLAREAAGATASPSPTGRP
jgi:hypothetical protein